LKAGYSVISEGTAVFLMMMSI